MNQALKALESLFPSENHTIRGIGEIHQWASAKRFEAFREPKAFVVRRAGKVEVGPVHVDELNGWRRHVTDGTFVRLHGLETSILSELVADRLTPALVIARAHMELAGLAAYSAEVLLSAGRDGAWDRLAKVVQQVYFGSSMRIQAKGTPALEDFLLEEVCPIRPSEFIKAMDRFVPPRNGKASTRHQMIYGLLSDFAHPVTSRSFFDVLSEDFGGWLLRYRSEDPLDSQSAKMALEILLGNMQVGYACASLLAQSSLVADGRDGFILRTPSEEEVGEIWLRLLEPTTAGKPPAA